MIEIQGDFSNILTYFTQMLTIQQRRNFEVHEFNFEYISHRIVINADSGEYIETNAFPSSNNADRVSMIEFSIRKGDLKNIISITWNCFTTDSIDETYAKELIEMIDSSTFRFF